MSTAAADSAIQSWNLSQHLMGRVRPLQAEDVPAVADLHEQVYGAKYASRRDALEANLRKLLLEHPWYDESLPSLVYEDNQGAVVGCVGVLPRPMSFDGRRVTAAVTHSFMVRPDSRGSMAALQLTRRFFEGPQDLSLADGNNYSRRIWEACGGITSLLYSLCWTRALRPSRYALSFLRNRGLPAVLVGLLRPLCGLVDLLAPGLSGGEPAFTDAEAQAADLSGDDFAGLLPQFLEDRTLLPVYDSLGATWLLGTLEVNTSFGDFHKCAVRSRQGRTLGWYLYYLKPGGIADVAQIVTTRGGADRVLDHLFRHAWEQGAIAVSGQLDPSLFHELTEKHCIFHHSGATNSWSLVHAREPGLLQAVHDGRAFLTRTETEWWISSILG